HQCRQRGSEVGGMLPGLIRTIHCRVVSRDRSHDPDPWDRLRSQSPSRRIPTSRPLHLGDRTRAWRIDAKAVPTRGRLPFIGSLPPKNSTSVTVLASIDVHAAQAMVTPNQVNPKLADCKFLLRTLGPRAFAHAEVEGGRTLR